MLYSGWTEYQAPVISTTPTESCTTAGFYCESFIDCKEAGGAAYNNFECPGLLECCSININDKTCSEQSGKVCRSNEECSGTEVGSSDGSCCLGVCRELQSQETECEQNSGFCVSSCDSQTETETSDSCNSASKVCCVLKPAKSSSSLGIWIIILFILIALVVLAIVFRHKIQLMIFKFKRRGSVSSAPVMNRRPPFPPMLPPRPPMRMRQTPAQIPRQQTSKLDKEMEETLKKLREMSK